MNINNRLITFAQQELVLARTANERDRINTSLSHLEKILKDNLGHKIKEFVRFGSFTRNTILPRKYDDESDVDLMVVFDTSNGSHSPNTYRKWVLDVIQKAYPNSISKKDFPVVKLELNHIMFDIVPAISSMSWFETNYQIPGSNNSWMATKPNDINSQLSSLNSSTSNNLTRNVVRLMKHWNAKAGYPYQSYLMEKKILNGINVFSFFENSTYDEFLEILEYIAGSQAGVRQALNYIKKYQGNMWTVRDEGKEWFWVKKLLPGLDNIYP